LVGWFWEFCNIHLIGWFWEFCNIHLVGWFWLVQGFCVRDRRDPRDFW
jgi:hypothetical protein